MCGSEQTIKKKKVKIFIDKKIFFPHYTAYTAGHATIVYAVYMNCWVSLAKLVKLVLAF